MRDEDLFGIPDDDRQEHGLRVPKRGVRIAPPALTDFERDELHRSKATRVLEHVRVDVERGDLHPSLVADRVADRLAKIRPPRAKSLPNMAARFGRMAGKYKRIPTGCVPLDALTGGGMQTRRLMVIGGAPGSLKTTYALSLAHEIARAGAATAPAVVMLIAVDEGGDGLLSRLGQMYGSTRAGLEDEDPDISQSHWDYARQQYLATAPNLYVIDPDDDDDPDTVDEAIELTAARAKELGARLVLVVDSLQTAPFRSDRAEGSKEKSTKERIDGRVASLKAAVKRLDALVIAVSELNRSAYGKDGQLTLAAFKESGGIEYGVDVALLLKRVPDTKFTTDVHVVKNRLGDHGTFRLERDARLGFTQIPMPDELDEEAAINEERQARRRVKVEELAEQLLVALVEAKVPITSRRDLRALVEGGGSEIKEDAISLLVAQGRIERVKKEYLVRYSEEVSDE